MPDAVVGVERDREGDAELGQPDEVRADGEGVDQVEVMRVTSG